MADDNDTESSPVAEWMQGVAMPLILLPGVAGNVGCMVYLRHATDRLLAFRYFFTAMAAADTLVLLSAVPRWMQSLQGMGLTSGYSAACRAQWWLSIFSVQLSACMLLALMTVRVAMALWPRSLKSWRSKRVVVAVVGICVVGSAGLSLHVFFAESNRYEGHHCLLDPDARLMHVALAEVWFLTDAALSLMVPLCGLLCGNAFIVVRLHKAIRKEASMRAQRLPPFGGDDHHKYSLSDTISVTCKSQHISPTCSEIGSIPIFSEDSKSNAAPVWHKVLKNSAVMFTIAMKSAVFFLCLTPSFIFGILLVSDTIPRRPIPRFAAAVLEQIELLYAAINALILWVTTVCSRHHKITYTTHFKKSKIISAKSKKHRYHLRSSRNKQFWTRIEKHCRGAKYNSPSQAHCDSSLRTIETIVEDVSKTPSVTLSCKDIASLTVSDVKESSSIILTKTNSKLCSVSTGRLFSAAMFAVTQSITSDAQA